MDQAELRALLAEMFEDHKEHDPSYSYARFGADLARMIGRAEPYKKGYVYAVMKGQAGYKVSPELAAGLQKMAAIADGVPEFLAKLQEVPANVLSMSPIPAGAVVMGTARQCAKEGCGLWFTSDNPRRRYCPRCRPPRPRT